MSMRVSIICLSFVDSEFIWSYGADLPSSRRGWLPSLGGTVPSTGEFRLTWEEALFVLHHFPREEWESIIPFMNNSVYFLVYWS